MTFVLNVLHNDYSLLVADKQANTDGPATLRMGEMTIQVVGSVKIEGFRKIKISKNGTVAVGISGTVRSHSFFSDFENYETSDCCLKGALDTSRERFLLPRVDLEEREIENNYLMTFFDPVMSRYFSILGIFSSSYMHHGWHRSERGGATLLHIGTGSNKFEEAVGLDEINRFISSIKNDLDPNLCVTWIRTAFEKVSAIAIGVGKNPEFFLSTRDHPNFNTFNPAS